MRGFEYMDKQMKRNKICFGLGTVGRDALYSLVSMYLLVHLTDVVGFSDGGLAVIGIMLTLFGIFDAVIPAKRPWCYTTYDWYDHAAGKYHFHLNYANCR